MAREKSDSKEFVSILSSDGSLRLTVPDGTEGAIKREYKVTDEATKEEVTKTKNEIVFKALSGKVTNVSFADTKFGTLLQVTVTDEEGDLTISTNASNNFGIDFMKKLPAMDFSKDYRIAPFSFEGEKGKTIRGVSISEGLEQDKEAPKVTNFFYDGKKDINGFPSPKGDTTKYTKNKWKAYFGEVEDFLIDYTKENILPKFAEKAEKKEGKDGEEDF